MDRIIYMYRWKQPEQTQLYKIKEYDFGDYQLCKVGISEVFLQICREHMMVQAKTAIGKKYRSEKKKRRAEIEAYLVGKFPGRKRIAGRQRRKLKMQWEQEQKLLEKFQKAIGIDVPGSSIVCQEPMPCFAGREFNAYFQNNYVRHLLRYCGYGMDRRGGHEGGIESEPLHHFILLGRNGDISGLLYELVDDIKSLKWILPMRQFGQEQQELVDILYEEFGLAVEVRTFEESESFAKMYPSCRVPGVIIDFSEADRVRAGDVARGSIWLDIGASEEKRRRMEDRDTGICYFSLKKEWKQPQKALNILDTISKNGYNT